MDEDPDHIRSNPLDVPKRRTFRARDGVVVTVVALVVLVLFSGTGLRQAGEEMDPGPTRSIALAVGKPAAWVADRLPLAGIGDSVTSWLSPDDDVPGGAGFASAGERAGGVPRVTPESFTPEEVGAKPKPPPPLRTVLVTGDSMSQPLDVELARRLADRSVRTLREPHLGTGISKEALLDWGKLSAQQARRDKADAVVVLIGANEGFPMAVPGRRGRVECCSADWGAEYASRVRRMMDTYRRGGAARVYWLTLPTPRNAKLQIVARLVNAAMPIAASAYRTDVRVLDLERLFTPGGRFRSAMDVDGEKRIVRDPDGVHLNEEGAKLAADRVLRALDEDFSKRP